MRVALYLRVSTERQELANQRRQLTAFCKQRDWQITREYREKRTGTAAREVLNEALADAERREYDLLLFWSLDRLSREGPLKTLLYLERLTRPGVAFRSYQESFLDSTGLGELLVPIFAWIAKQESVRRGERIRAGFERIRAGGKTRSGRPIGRPAAEIPLETLRKAREKRQAGYSWSRLSRLLSMPSTTLRMALQKPSPKIALKKPPF